MKAPQRPIERRIDLSSQPWEPPRKDRPKSNRVRTAAIVAGNAGLLYGGVKIGQAANEVRRTAMIAGQAAENTRAITGAVRSPLRALRKKVFKFSARSLRKDRGGGGEQRVMQHGRVVVFAEKPKRENAAAVMGVSSALTGGLLGGLPTALRRGAKLRGVLKATGSGAALGGVLGTGSALIGSKVLGDPKEGDGAAYAKRGAVGGAIGGALLGGAGVLALRKVRGKLPIVGSPARALVSASRTFHPARWVRKTGLPAAVAIGAAGAGAVGAFQGADEGSGVDTLRAIKRPKQFSAIHFDAPLTGRLAADRYRKKIQDDDLDRRDANTGRAAVAGALAGMLGKSAKLSRLKRAGLGALAGIGGVAAVRAATSGTKDYYGERSRGAKGAEKVPAITGLGTAAVLAGKRLRLFGTRGLRRTIEFGGRQQLRDETNRYVDPLKVASGESTAYTDGERLDLPVQHAQVVRAAIHKGQGIHRTGVRVGSLLKDAVGAATGQPKVDSRGRTQKREWEKSWFKNAAGTAATAGALLGHAALMKRNPAYRKKVAGFVRAGKDEANKFVPDLFPMAATLGPGMIRFDETQGDWDIRDARGKSARVFAPGAQQRTRREKKEYERVGFLRKAAVAGAVLAAAGGTALGYRLGTRRAALRKITPPTAMPNVIRFPEQA